MSNRRLLLFVHVFLARPSLHVRKAGAQMAFMNRRAHFPTGVEAEPSLLQAKMG
jgi:hypothetical protein